jgi:hypothetical protein
MNRRRLSTNIGVLAILALLLIVAFILYRKIRQPELNSHLIAALRARDVTAEVQALNEGADANTSGVMEVVGNDVGREPAILIGVLDSDEDAWIGCVVPLLNHGADVNTRDASGFNLLSYACMYKAPRLAKLLIDRGANVNVADNLGQTPLMQASGADDPQIVRILLNAGADVNRKDSLGQTAMSRAQKMGAKDVVTLFNQASIRQ